MMKSVYIALIFGAVALFAVCNAEVKPITAATVKPTPSPWFQCPGDGSFVNPYNCHKYFVCISDTAWGLNCPANLYFNEKKGICDLKSNADCHEIVTKPPKPSH